MRGMMNARKLATKAREVISRMAKSDLGPYIDESLTPPTHFRGKGEIKLIILGQDPTVHDSDKRKNIKVTLLLNQPGSLRRYIEEICKGLDINLGKNIYATNLLKNFFTIPPDIKRKEDPQFLQKAAEYWITLLKEEIEEFKNIPVLTLGEPVLNCLTKTHDEVLIRYSWGFEEPGQYGEKRGYINPPENVLNRIIFPFPHLPGLKHKIYKQQMDGYLKFIKKYINK